MSIIPTGRRYGSTVETSVLCCGYPPGNEGIETLHRCDDQNSGGNDDT